MSMWLVWMIASMFLGRPVLRWVMLVALAVWAIDRFTTRRLTSPLRFLDRWRRMSRLKYELSLNPHNRQARRELADLYLERGRYARVVELLRPNLEAGDDEPATLFTMAVGMYGTGHADGAEQLMESVLERDPRFRLGAVQLERGRWRLARGAAGPARDALQALIQERTGTVEGRVLLAQALDKLGEHAQATKLRNEAWEEYRTTPRHLRKLERFWAWRARPSRPLLYLALVLAGLGFLAVQIQKAAANAEASSLSREASLASDPGDDD